MHSRLILAFGSAAWLMMANLASAEEIGTGSEKTAGGTQADVSSGDEGSVPGDVGSGVEYRRTDHSDDKSRTGRNDNDHSSGGRSGGQSDSSGGEGDGGGAVD
jgi:hypothetical protein